MIVGLLAGMDPDEIIAVPARPSCWAGAKCRSSGVNFFPERGESTGPAKALYAVCPAQDACLAFAVAEGMTDGVWGGTSPRSAGRCGSGSGRLRDLWSQRGHGFPRTEPDQAAGTKV